MWNLALKHLLHIRPPHIQRLPRQAENQINTDIMEPGLPATRDGILCLQARMAPAKQSEQGVVEGLDSHTDTIDRCGQNSIQPRWSHVVGIGLYRHFGILGQSKQTVHLSH